MFHGELVPILYLSCYWLNFVSFLLVESHTSEWVQSFWHLQAALVLNLISWFFTQVM